MKRERRNVRRGKGYILRKDEVVPLAPAHKTLKHAGCSSLLNYAGPLSIILSPGVWDMLERLHRDTQCTQSCKCRALDGQYSLRLMS